ncbi:hypothetical protein EZS27_009345 [termite gut metagenome]|uniref:Uncharacterized protein n=1 Tax=termite gut metagenome TaxID=433724 RepID=A0A5J4SC73_9ZZZZ
MKNLLENKFVSYYGLAASVTVNVVSTTDTTFDLIDDANLVCPSGQGTAKYNNPSRKEVNVISYDNFITSLPHSFRERRERCDLIVYTSDSSHFILNELTETEPQYVSDHLTEGKPKTGKKNKAISQLKQTLEDISAVPKINSFIIQCTTKHCCFFNKPPTSPTGINAPIAFSRLSSISPNGINIPNPDIEAYGFEFWEFYDNQTYLLKDESSKVKTISEQLVELSTKDLKDLAKILQLNYGLKI